MASLDATALLAMLALSALALALFALVLKLKQHHSKVTCLWGRVGCGLCSWLDSIQLLPWWCVTVLYLRFCDSSRHTQLLPWWCVTVWYLSSFGIWADTLNSYHGDILNFAKQSFSDRLPFITKYCIMRECETIHSGYLYVCDLVFVMKKWISIFKFPEWVLEISLPEISLCCLFSHLFC